MVIKKPEVFVIKGFRSIWVRRFELSACFFATPFGRKLQSKNGESCISKKEKNAEGGMRAYQHPAIHHKQCSE